MATVTYEEPTDRGGSWARIRTAISTLLRLIMAAVFIYAGYTKVIDIPLAKLSVESYQIFPRDIAHIIGIVLPVLEIALGLLLLLGLGTRLVAIALSVMLVAFIAGIASLWIRGINVQCGCFGGSLLAGGKPNFALEIGRDVLMLAATVWLAIWPRTYFALEDLLGGRSTDPDADLEDDLDDAEAGSLADTSPR